MVERIKLGTGEVIEATLVRIYRAFEGGTRFIFIDGTGVEYRCIKDERSGQYAEYVA